MSGSLYSYTRSAAIRHCPADRPTVTGGVSLPHTRRHVEHHKWSHPKTIPGNWAYNVNPPIYRRPARSCLAGRAHTDALKLFLGRRHQFGEAHFIEQGYEPAVVANAVPGLIEKKALQ